MSDETLLRQEFPNLQPTTKFAIENAPEVRSALSAMAENANGKTLAVPMTLEAKEERNKYIVGLAMLGLTTRTILDNVNSQSVARGWNALKSEGEVTRIVGKHYQAVRETSGMATAEMEMALKEAAYDSMQKTLEEMIMYVKKRSSSRKKEDKWRAFEYMSALSEIAKLKQLLVENRNWNGSRTNPALLQIQQNTLQMNVYERGASSLLEAKRTPEMQSLIDTLKKSINSSDADVIEAH